MYCSHQAAYLSRNAKTEKMIQFTEDLGSHFSPLFCSFYFPFDFLKSKDTWQNTFYFCLVLICFLATGEINSKNKGNTQRCKELIQEGTHPYRAEQHK